MQFKVPQFLDIEDKIFGPFTFSQFVYLVGGAGLCFVLFKLLGLLVALLPMLVVAGISLALTFYRPNGKPLVIMLEAGFKYVMESKLYIWERKKGGKTKRENEENKNQENLSNNQNPRLGKSKLQDLAWSLDVLDLNNKEEKK